MPTLVSTGQFTIVDNNDARTISAVITSNVGAQQVFTKDESTAAYTPNWVASPYLVLTPKVYISGVLETNVWGSLSNKKFCFTAGGTAIANADTSSAFVANDGITAIAAGSLFAVVHSASASSTLTIKGNIAEATGTLNVFFEADYTDSITTLTTHIIVQLTISTVKTGTNAVFIVTRGQTNIEQAIGSTKNNIAIAADLIRGGVVDATGLTYKWYDATAQISTSTSGYATKYGFKNVVAPAIPPAAAGTAELNVAVPVAGAGNTNNTIVINESAVLTTGVYRVDITDAVAKTYSAYFTVSDFTDPYTIRINCPTGDKLQNGIGSSSLTPAVYYGSTQLTSTELAAYTFTWKLYDRNGKRGAFIDTAKINTSGGATISANGTTGSASFTYGGTSYAFVSGDVIKVVNSAGAAFFYEVASSTTNNVVIRSPATINTWLSATDFPVPSATTDFVNGKLYGCVSAAGNGARVTTGSTTAIVVTQDDIDAKCNIFCDASRP